MRERMRIRLHNQLSSRFFVCGLCDVLHRFDSASNLLSATLAKVVQRSQSLWHNVNSNIRNKQTTQTTSNTTKNYLRDSNSIITNVRQTSIVCRQHTRTHRLSAHVIRLTEHRPHRIDSASVHRSNRLKKQRRRRRRHLVKAMTEKNRARACGLFCKLDQERVVLEGGRNGVCANMHIVA